MQQLEFLLEPGSMTTLVPVMSTLHWLPIKHRIYFKILNGLAPQYLSELLSNYSPPRPLRSQNSGHLIIPRISKSTAGGRSFFYLAPVRPGSIDPMTAVVQRVKGFAYYSLSFSRHNKNIKMEHFFLYILSRYFI